MCLLAAIAGTMIAQSPTDWQAATVLPGLDLNGLTPAQKITVLKILREEGCSCGCSMQLAECRVKDPACTFSKGLASIVIKSVKEGKGEEQAIADLKASPLAKGPAPRPLLEDPIKIPTGGAPAKGPENARVTLVEFSDFECPYCSHAVGQVDALMKVFPNDIRLVYKQFPLSMHPHARLAAAAALAANQQGKFWQMHDALFKNFRQLGRERILALAKETGLDMDRFTADLNSGKFDAVVNNDLRDGEEAGVQGTPAFFINGKHYNGPMELVQVKPLIEAELKPVTAAK
jgi:protein-disulfide isomerase